MNDDLSMLDLSLTFEPPMQPLRTLLEDSLCLEGVNLSAYLGHSNAKYSAGDPLFEDSYSSTASTALPEPPKFLNHFSQPP